MIYASLRVSRRCLHAIQQYRDRLQVAVNANPERFARFGPSMRVSIDDAVTYLLDQQRSHAVRSKRSQALNAADHDGHPAYHDGPMTDEEVADSKRSANHL